MMLIIGVEASVVFSGIRDHLATTTLSHENNRARVL